MIDCIFILSQKYNFYTVVDNNLLLIIYTVKNLVMLQNYSIILFLL